ncbi:type II secretion system protein [Chitinimonas sp. BJYL2]|uniref:type II secretion system protein n=1 Tax=Chitinimonas sp. BJYL2 TaxID=2976696 RepID=UPI0022B5121E|nr:type II secretion system protein [Chitinimonas sp. BJYL2]
MARRMRAGKCIGLASQRGYGYVFVMLTVLLMGIYLARTGEVWSTEQRRQREARLMQEGDEIRRAIESYLTNGPAGVRSYPPSLAALVEDGRGGVIRRHLRRAYADPMTGRDWGYVPAPAGGIMGVYSRSTATPLKRSGFDAVYYGFAEQTTYQGWVFAAWPIKRGLGR